MKKYRFHELKNRPPDQALPVDVNEQAEAVCRRIGDERAFLELVKAREARRWHGTIFGYDKLGRLVVKFEIQKGMIPRYLLINYRESGVKSYEKSIHNDNLDMSKDKR